MNNDTVHKEKKRVWPVAHKTRSLSQFLQHEATEVFLLPPGEAQDHQKVTCISPALNLPVQTYPWIEAL